MKTLIKWIFSSHRNTLKFVMFTLAIIIIFVNLIIGFNYVKKNRNWKKAENAKLDSIEVKGQSIYIDGEEVYRFLPVQGGTLSVRDSTGRRDIECKKFYVGGEIQYHRDCMSMFIIIILVSSGYAEYYFD